MNPKIINKRVYQLVLLVGVQSLFFCTPQHEKDRVAYEAYLRSHPFNQNQDSAKTNVEEEQKDRPDLAWQQNFLMTMDPQLKQPTPQRLIKAQTRMPDWSRLQSTPGESDAPWIERGPNNVAGRTRALLWDPGDLQGTKVWAAGVSGGLWYNNDIYSSTSTWIKVDDFWDNLAISSMAIDPTDPQVMYVGTGEAWGNFDAVRGLGIWKSADGGTTWQHLQSTTNFYFVTDLVVRNEGGTGVLYAGVASSFNNGDFFSVEQQGLQRSVDGGNSFTNVSPDIPGMGQKIVPADLEIGPDNRIWLGSYRNIYSLDDRGGGYIFFSDDGTNFTQSYQSNVVNGFGRVELAAAPSNANYVYAIIESERAVFEIVRSIDGGTSWTQMNEPNDADTGIPADDFSRGQAWYDLIAAVDPNNENSLYAGAIDLFKSNNGGDTWIQVSHWYGGFGFPEVHADHHAISFKPGSSTDILFGSDGGVDLTQNGTSSTPSFLRRNNGYNITQFYSVAMHPDAGMDYFLGGTQDNGTHQFTSTGVNSTNEVTGGDGGYTFIDQTESNIQISSYVRNSYFLSTNGGSTFSTIIDDQNTGRFINPSDYDDQQNVLYTATDENSIGRVTGIPNSPNRNDITISLGATASHLRVSPYTTSSTTLFVGTSAGRVFRITEADGTTPQINEITGNLPQAWISCIEVGASEDQLLVTFSNYGVVSVWETTDGGANWVSKEGDLPDMPVRWALYNPENYQEVILATELGIWQTGGFNTSSPSWMAANEGLANVRVDMLQIRNSDLEVIAATHGRGMFTSSGFANVSFRANFSADQSTILPGESIQFSDNSLGDIVSWSWSFPGGEPSTSTAQNPSITYANEGTFDVTLTVTNGNGESDSKALSNFITVSSSQDLTDLTPYNPSAWDDVIVVRNQLSNNSDFTDSNIKIGDETYLNFALLNSGNFNLEEPLPVRLLVDGVAVIDFTFDFSSGSPLQPNYFNYGYDFSISSLSAGSHSVEFIIDPDNVVAEVDESNNTYTRDVYVQESCGGSNTLTALSGEIEDGSGPSEYLSNLNCEWFIQPDPAPSTIQIDFDSFSTESGYDFLRIYDGSDNLLEELSGTSLPPSMTLNSSSLRVAFTTDGSVQRDGWSFTYQAGSENIAPEISDQTFTLEENSPINTVVGTITASDANNDALSYSITDGNIDTAFRVRSNGELLVNNALPIDFEVNPTFTLTVEVSDDEFTSSATITIELLNRDDNNAPHIEEQNFTVARNIGSNQDIGIIEASDPDGDGVIYTIIGGDQTSLFQLGMTSGMLSTASGANFETIPEDTLKLQIRVSDGLETASAEVTVILQTITDVTNASWIDIFPNPAEDETFITNSTGRKLVIQVMDASGKTIREQQIAPEGQIRLDVSQFATGNYLILANDGKELSTFKLIKR